MYIQKHVITYGLVHQTNMPTTKIYHEYQMYMYEFVKVQEFIEINRW